MKSERSSIGGDENSSLQGCYTMLYDKYLPWLWRHCTHLKCQYLFTDFSFRYKIPQDLNLQDKLYPSSRLPFKPTLKMKAAGSPQISVHTHRTAVVTVRSSDIISVS
jgi:hypothetical protein